MLSQNQGPSWTGPGRWPPHRPAGASGGALSATLVSKSPAPTQACLGPHPGQPPAQHANCRPHRGCVPVPRNAPQGSEPSPGMAGRPRGPQDQSRLPPWRWGPLPPQLSASSVLASPAPWSPTFSSSWAWGQCSRSSWKGPSRRSSRVSASLEHPWAPAQTRRLAPHRLCLSVCLGAGLPPNPSGTFTLMGGHGVRRRRKETARRTLTVHTGHCCVL